MKTKVVKIYKQGQIEELKIEETNLKEIGEDDVVIEHYFCGLNFIDINQRNGLYPLKQLPIEVGMEASGVVLDTGKNSIEDCKNILIEGVLKHLKGLPVKNKIA